MASPSCRNRKSSKASRRCAAASLALRLREVSAAQGDDQGGQPLAGAHPLGKHLVDLADMGVHEGAHERAEGPLGQPLRRRVDGHEPPGVQPLVVPRLHPFPVLDLDGHLAAMGLDLAVQDEALPAREHPGEMAARSEEGGHRKAALVAQHGREGRPGARRRRADTHDHAGARAHVAGAQLAQRGETRPVLVADGDEEEGILNGLEILAREQRRAPRSDALDELQGRLRDRGRPRFASPARLCYTTDSSRRRVVDSPRSVHGPAM